MPHWFEYISPSGSVLPVKFDPRATRGPYYLMRNPSGLGNLSLNTHSRKGTRRVGETLRAVTKGKRVVAMQVAVLAHDDDEYWSLRERLIAALNLEGPPHTNLQQGLLRFHRSNQPTVELDVVPFGPDESARPDSQSVIFDIEFEASNPLWRETSDNKSVLQATETGMEFPLEHPWESIAASSIKDLNNKGTVAVPVQITIYGATTDPYVSNFDYNEGMYLIGDILDGERVEIDTTPGNRRVEHFDSNGNKTNWMSNVDMAQSVFWFLRKGGQSVEFNAASISGGYAEVYWRNRYGGV